MKSSACAGCGVGSIKEVSLLVHSERMARKPPIRDLPSAEGWLISPLYATVIGFDSFLSSTVDSNLAKR
jgi:hypothetical protein